MDTGCFSLQDFVDQMVSASTSSNVARHTNEESAAMTQTNAEYQYMDDFTDEDFQAPGEYTHTHSPLIECTYAISGAYNHSMLSLC